MDFRIFHGFFQFFHHFGMNPLPMNLPQKVKALSFSTMATGHVSMSGNPRMSASLLTMLSVAHMFSCLLNQCSRSFSVLFVWPMTLAALQGLQCCCQLVFCSKEEHLFLRYDLWNVRWRQKSNLTLPLLSYSEPVDNVECCAYVFLSAEPVQ